MKCGEKTLLQNLVNNTNNFTKILDLQVSLFLVVPWVGL